MFGLRAIVTSMSGLLFAAGTAHAGSVNVFSPTQQTVEAMEQAVGSTSVELSDVYGSTGNLAYSGSFTATSWSLSLSGTIGGNAASFSFTGSTTGPDAGNISSGSYTETGTVGGDSWSGSGSWDGSPDTNAGDPAGSVAITWNSSDDINFAHPGTKPTEHDTDVVKEFHGPDGTDYIEYYKTIDHMQVGDLKHEESNDDEDLGGRSSVRSSMNFYDSGVSLNGITSFDAGSTTGSVNVTPLPSGAWAGLVLMGGCGLFHFRKRFVGAK